jgi:hypothetical protein
MAPTSPSSEATCPNCGRSFPAEERFCPDCHLPLTFGEEEPDVSERRARARKVKPQYSEGRLVKVAGARNQAEAEFLVALLLEEGVPSFHRRSAGFDVPDFLAAGPRDIVVPESGAEAARDVLLQADLGGALPGGGGDAPLRVLGWLLAACVLVALVAWLTADVL